VGVKTWVLVGALWVGLASAQAAVSPPTSPSRDGSAQATAPTTTLLASAGPLFTTPATAVLGNAGTGRGTTRASDSDAEAAPHSWLLLLAGAFLIGSVLQRRLNTMR